MAGTNKVSPEFTHVDASDNPSNTPGTVIEADGLEYRYVKNQATDSATAGYPVIYMDADPHDNEWEITADMTDGITDAFAGIAVATMGAAEYGWVLRRGVYESIAATASVETVGFPLQLIGGSTDRYFTLVTAVGEPHHIIAMETTTAAATDVAGWVNGL